MANHGQQERDIVWMSDYEEEQLKREMAQALVNPTLQIMYTVTEGTNPAHMRHILRQRLSGVTPIIPPRQHNEDH
jgi:hypothetical protein